LSVGDAFKALRQIVLLHANVERLDANVASMNSDIAGLAEGVAPVRDRVSRLEGIIEGVGRAGRAGRTSGPRLPRK
jgi:hypothetical protein